MKVKFALDTSCLVALVSSWHEFHARTKQAYEARRRRHERLVVPVHVLLESFAVLTRLPVRLAPEDAQRILEENFFQTAGIAGLAGGTAWAAVRELSRRGMGGGIIYDTAIALAALEAGASVLLTLNVKDFLRVAPAGLDIQAP
jgi:predicted nucleic acid-binding protein